jgi:hypothetical protein
MPCVIPSLPSPFVLDTASRLGPAVQRAPAIPKAEQSPTGEATNSLLFLGHPKINPKTEENFSHPKNVHPKTTFPPPNHHKLTTKNHPKTLWKSQNPL